MACLGAIEVLGWPLDRIVHAEVWATDNIPSDLPPMVEFKVNADKITGAIIKGCLPCLTAIPVIARTAHIALTLEHLRA